MIDVSCAIIEQHGKILATRRGKNMHLEGYWEFPGGKVEPGETLEECISREIKEELSLGISIKGKLPVVEFIYPDKAIKLTPFVCRIISGEITLKDHTDFKWIEPNSFDQLKWAPADVMVIELYLKKANREKVN
jgi:8-oxo-dGTP diphosphatase